MMMTEDEINDLAINILAPLAGGAFYGRGSEAEVQELIDFAKEAIPKLLRECQEHGMTDLRHIAYLIGTIERESRFGRVMEEDVSRAEASGYTGGWDYRGRGYIQLTHRGNYQRVSDYLNEDRPLGQEIDLVENPELIVEDKDLSAEVAVRGMLGKERNADWFTDKKGHTIERFIPTDRPTTNRDELREDFLDARAIVNGRQPRSHGHRQEIADRSLVYYDALDANEC